MRDLEEDEHADQDHKIELPKLIGLDPVRDVDVGLAADDGIGRLRSEEILSQVGEDGKRYPSRFGSITWNERERNYSQAKVELYGLMRALRAFRVFIVGLKNLTVEVDAKYIKGMLNNPDIQPNATINRWIAAILTFDFKLVHVPAAKHTGADGLSRRRAAPEDGLLNPDELQELFSTVPLLRSAYDEWGLRDEHRIFNSRIHVPEGRQGGSDPMYTSYTHYCNSTLGP